MPYVPGLPGESITCSLQSMWYGDTSEKSVLGDQLNKNFIGQQLIKKEPEAPENYCSTEKNGDL